MTKVLIVGGGVAGLSAGSYLQMNGYDTEIFELNNNAGGLCVSWKRKGYTIDGCIHWLIGGNPIDPFYPILNGLVDMENFPRVTFEEYCSVEEDGRILRFFGDLDKLEIELKTVSPQDSKIIEEMISGAREIASIHLSDTKAQEIMNVWDKLRSAGKMRRMMKAFNAWKMPVEEYSKKIKSPLIKKLLINSRPFSSGQLMIDFLIHAAYFHNKNASYPEGGAKEFVERIVHRYESLGGKIHYKSTVAKICVEKDCVKGIQLCDGKTHSADYIISAADGHHTICNLLEGHYVDENIKRLYFTEKNVPKMSQIYVSLGVARSFEDSFKPYVYIPLKNPLKLGNEEITDVGVTIHNFDSTAAPAGKTVLTMTLWIHNTEYWVKLRSENRAKYDKEKEKIVEHLIEEINAHFGNIKGKIEMTDIATPATYIRYTNNWNGSCCGWEDPNLYIDKPKKEIKGLKNFFMCGLWVGDSGLSAAAKSGRDIAQILCKRDRKKFKTLPF